MDKESPLYSVVIPTHARPELVRRAARSAFVHDHPSEILVVEDRTEDAQGIAEHLGVPTDRLRYLRNSTGQTGASATRNLGVEAARGRFIVFLDDDDEFVPHYLDRPINYFPASQSYWGFADQFKVNGIDSGTTVTTKPRSNNAFARNIAGMSAGFWIERATFLRLGGLDLSLTVDEDTDMCCRLMGEGIKPHYMADGAVLLNRDSETPRLTNATQQAEITACYLRTYRKNIEACRALPGAEAYLLLRAHRMLCRNGEFAKARALEEQTRNWRILVEARLQEWNWRLRHGNHG